MYIPEPPAAPPEEDYIVASCGHEIYEDEIVFEDEDGSLCAECVEDRLSELPAEYRAALMGYSPRRVSFREEGE